MKQVSLDFGFSGNLPLGIECLIVNPADIPKSQKDSLQKTDPRDARNLRLRLQENCSMCAATES